MGHRDRWQGKGLAPPTGSTVSILSDFYNGHCWNQPKALAPVNLVLSDLPQAATPSCFPPVKVMPASERDTDDVSWTMTFQSLV